MIAADNRVLQLIKEHKSGKPVGITSVCSAHSYVIKAAILNAKRNNQIALIESTSNQVDQYGGYTGITPSGFREFVYKIANECEFPVDNLILGGDHLGPNRWQDEPSDSAMQKAQDQIAAYVSAGYTKIHLDASMKCADDGNRSLPLDSSIIAERAAQLCRKAEDTFQTLKEKSEYPVYIIGTDVPPPGGAFNPNNEIHVTSCDDVEATIDLTRRAFEKYNLTDAWNRVVAVVVQPGVEFGDTNVFDYNRNRAEGLISLIEQKEHFVYEAHSTDYQKKDSLQQMVKDHFAILKVGPWLTYSFREAIFALANIENELLSGSKSSTLSNVVEIIDSRMKADQKYWAKYYSGTEEEKKFKRKYSYSDRIRYYWVDSEINNSVNRMMVNLSDNTIPDTLISQYLPDQYYALREEEIKATPQDLIIHRILKVLEMYNYAAFGGLN